MPNKLTGFHTDWHTDSHTATNMMKKPQSLGMENRSKGSSKE
jgi:succinylglutamate desuccinylase